ncbi:ABC transporter permease [Brooklawnia cerclae]|uniref:Simple sugar transport system permease protein n=1 Tax=Brooklawnia cerclae TaxID=349934 RepID=A0ABX0SIZ5_9ACTN|nr:ABC transporter permease [Brooklawnia cerclae]NIH58382.1 simple sugar transport system permease protein [Brooklawnia cerclae]
MQSRFGPRAHTWSLIGLVLGLTVLLSALAPQTFPTVGNLQSMAVQIAPLGLLALCIAITFLIGGIDLSCVNVANGSAVIAALVMNALAPSTGAGPATAIGLVAALCTGLLAGLVNGLVIAMLRVHPIPTTLGTSAVFLGIFTGITNGSTVFGQGTLGSLSTSTVALLPLSFWVFLLAVAALMVVTQRTRLGFRLYAIGESTRVSRFARMRVERDQVIAYMISGLFASLAGILLFAGLNAANVSFGSSYLTQALLIAVIAGMDPYGGSGRVGMVALAAIAAQELQTGLNMVLGGWSGSAFASDFAWGVLLIAILGFSRWLGRRTARRRREQATAALVADGAQGS